jgi:Domain of unknown function (DUF4926)
MKLPNADQAIVEDSKLLLYLLSSTHRDGKHKAKFFRMHGYSEELAEVLRRDLITIAQRNPVDELTRAIRWVKVHRAWRDGRTEWEPSQNSNSLVYSRGRRVSTFRNSISTMTDREANQIEELEQVALAKDIPLLGLVRGDVGTVVFVHRDHAAFEVEFITAEGHTLGVETLDRNDVSPVTGNTILHVRELEPA